MALIRLPLELHSVHNHILSGSIIPNYEAASEQLLCLATPHVFGLISTPSPTKSSTLASHYYGHCGRNKGHGVQRHSICGNHCNHYNHIEAECHTKAIEQHRKPRVATTAQLTIIKYVTILVMIIMSSFSTKHLINHYHMPQLLRLVTM